MLVKNLFVPSKNVKSYLIIFFVATLLVLKLSAMTLLLVFDQKEAKKNEPQKHILSYQVFEFDFAEELELRSSIKPSNRKTHEKIYNTIYKNNPNNLIITSSLNKRNYRIADNLVPEYLRNSRNVTIYSKTKYPKAKKKNKKTSILDANLSIERLNQRICLSTAIYFEARSEPIQGQWAVAEVILNRVKSKYYPDTICEVVFEGQNRLYKCQFSFACDGQKDSPVNSIAWARAMYMAGMAVFGKKKLNKLSNATHYHADYVKPYWAPELKFIKQIGRHIFYSSPRRG